MELFAIIVGSYSVVGAIVFVCDYLLNTVNEGCGYPLRARSKTVHATAKALFPIHRLICRRIEERVRGLSSL